MSAVILFVALATAGDAQNAPTPAAGASVDAPVSPETATSPQATAAADVVPEPAAAPSAPKSESAPEIAANAAPVATGVPAAGEDRTGRIASTIALIVGLGLSAAGLIGLGSAVALQISPWPSTPKASEEPRKTAITLCTATAAGGLMLGLTATLGGAFGLIAP